MRWQKSKSQGQIMHADDFFAFSALSKGEALRHKHHLNRSCLHPSPTTASFMRPNMVIPSFSFFCSIFPILFFLSHTPIPNFVAISLLLFLLSSSSSSLSPKDYHYPKGCVISRARASFYYATTVVGLLNENALHYDYILHLVFSLFLHLII